ncbi:MAG TPA: hypothetical protein VMV98_08090 [Acidobacteriaceae bacterium]|nr:hypothetical protein [Acidobacteriaceae bacterium]
MAADDMRMVARILRPFGSGDMAAMTKAIGTLNADALHADMMHDGRVVMEVTIPPKQALLTGFKVDGNPDMWEWVARCIALPEGFDFTWTDSDGTLHVSEVYRTEHWPECGKWIVEEGEE